MPATRWTRSTPPSLGLLRDGQEQAERAPQRTLDDLAALVNEMRDAGLALELRVDGAKPPLPGEVDRSAYRIVQEALTNTIRHAGLVRTRVRVCYTPGDVELEIADDGATDTRDGGRRPAGQGRFSERMSVVSKSPVTAPCGFPAAGGGNITGHPTLAAGCKP